jgi:xanthine dehydrogenase YagS FAD-binding subunit
VLTLDRPASIDEAVRSGAGPARAAYIAGGTDLIPLMRAGIASPGHLVDLGRSSLPAAVEIDASGGLVIGAASRMAEVAAHPVVRERFPVVAQALLASASAQVRNAASIGGNLMQRTRCVYFRDPVFPCNKRDAGSGCPAQAGDHRRHAILGGSPSCVAVHASDLAVALVALDASVVVRGPGGERRLALAELHLDPGETPWRESLLEEGELILAIELPPGASRSAYVKLRDRASFDFALVAAAAVVHIEEGAITRTSIALGGVAPRPWRLRRAEARLAGSRPTRADVDAAVRADLADARPLPRNGFKVELARRAALRAVALAAENP